MMIYQKAKLAEAQQQKRRKALQADPHYQADMWLYFQKLKEKANAEEHPICRKD